MYAREDVHPTGIGMSRSLLERHRTVAPAHTAASRRLRRRSDTPSDGGGSPPVAESWYAALSAPLRWSARPALERQEEIGRHLDFVVRDTRGRRGTGRYLRSCGSSVPDLAAAVGDLAQLLSALAAAFDDPGARETNRGRWRSGPPAARLRR